MITANRATELSLNIVTAVMLLLATPALVHGFNIPMGWFPISYATYLKAVGYVLVLAAITEVFLKRGQWGRWGFAFFFAVVAFKMLSEKLPTEFPISPEGKFGLAIYGVLLSFGAAHLQHKSKEKTT
ncbi:MAG: hypothetical protein UY70_C0006G0010 [Candidatus Kaiserbacteria bacterium GW2011_GWB1_52_6]|uniref:Uncharacterized protein n=2 Tax=Candidatus Kaiseribacteriota TaxID=1752734 RepID=A0A0G2AEC5_9BACT|nr:MAG: hypothetical protein UY70_C0006G0010 [Candidatus Kaiserbacteria bacterium GW2011_GWB1_52_6]KKW30814.1 MAG: hypothetical protein UY74_C0031G0012 [Candidatus Kaiserbacteria bacterium GW2011_GWC2_52_8b]